MTETNDEHSSDSASEDLLTSILWNRFQAISEEMYDTTELLAFSFSIREWADESATLMTADCEAIGESRRNVPVLSGSVSRAARIILSDHIDRGGLAPGDVVITNDPWIGCGHLSDVVVLSPVFSDGELVSFVGSVGHVGDVGGMMGGWATDTQQVYEEGILIPPCKLYEGGERVETVEAFIRENVRIPDRVVGDIEALRSANALGIDRIQQVVDEYGLETFESVSENILARSAEAFRAEVRGIEDGIYRQTLDFAVSDHELEIQVAIGVDGGDLRVDFEGSSDEIPAGINCPFTSTRAATAHTLKALIVPELKNADGVWEHIDITAPEGTIVNCSRPMATDGRHMTYHPVQNAVIQALEPAIPDRVLTGAAGGNATNLNGVDEAGQEFVAIDANVGPFPARSHKDGLQSTFFPSELKNVPIEIFEQYCPVRIEKRGLLPDMEGAGEYRGGARTETVLYNPLDARVDVSFTSDHSNYPPEGLQGGHDGWTSSIESLSEERELPENGRTKLYPDERFTVRSASCGGYGDPSERPRELVERDVKNGIISAERAADVYDCPVE